MFHTRDHFVPLDIYIYISFLLSPIQPLFPSNPYVPHPLSSLFRMSSSSSLSFFFSPSNTIRRSLLWMKNGYSWFLQFLGYFISDILCSATLVRIYRVAEIDCCFDNRRIFVALEGPHFTKRERERESRAMWIQIYTVVRENITGKFWWKNN